jgi:NAD(P)-dependent dehydrogenase (short-subunit alcohol dehydrogenase family)
MSEISFKKLFDLKGKTAIVTGGVGILGRQFCSILAEFGANIAVVDIQYTKAKDFAAELEIKFGQKSAGFYCDVTNPESVDQMVKDVVAIFGEIHILHNNAAGKSKNLSQFFAPLEEYELDQWNQIMDINIGGMFLVSKYVGKVMVEQNKGGSIIQTSSIYGIMGPDNRIYEGSYYLEHQINTPAVYAASKSAVVGLTKYLATYWASNKIRVNTITPGGVESGQNDIFIQKYSNRVPLLRMGKPYEIAGALIYLASDASSYVTGQNMVVDGGLSVW